jgi:hypothetical protein
MNVLKFLIISVALAGTSVLSSCKKEGCIDSSSVNYSADAKKDDGSCKYEGEAVIWYGEDTSQELMLEGVSTLKFYVDSKLVGSTSASVYWASAPACGANGSITITKDLGSAKNKTYTYTVEDDLGFTVAGGILNFEANSCESVEIVY